MKIYIIERCATAPVPIEAAFAFFENPRNLERLTPPWLNFKILSTEPLEMRKGAEIVYRIKWCGVPLAWRTVISEYEPGHRFVDEQAAGPYRLWRHVHTFEPSAEGTVVRDRVEYALPFGILGRMVHRLLIRRHLDRIFDYRREALREVFRPASTAR